MKNISVNNLFISFGIFFLLFTFIGNIFKDVLTTFIIFSVLVIILINYYIYVKKYLYYLIIILIGSIGGVFSSYYANDIILKKISIIDPYFDIKYKISGEITGINKIKEFESEYIIRLKKIGKFNNNPSPSGLPLTLKEGINIEGLIIIPSNFDIKKGDIIEFSEKLKKIENFNNSFDYEKYLFSRNIYFKVNAGSIHTIGKVDRNFIVDNIDRTRQLLLDRINFLYPEEEAIFLGGILLGARESMPEDLKTDFNNSGLTHFIAVSGFNITILIVFLSYILKIFPGLLRILLITLSVGGFVILVGDSISVVRASIMGLIGYYITISGRTSHNLAVIVFVGIIMVFISPLSINYDVSLHLSFLAVLGILYMQNLFKKIFYFVPNFLAIREALVLTLSAMTFALPIILINFGQVSTMSVFANIAVTWTIPLAMLGGFISILVDFVYHGFAVWISYFTWILLAWDIKIVHFFGGLDWSIWTVDLGIYKNNFQIFYFMILIFLIIVLKKN